MSEIVEELTIIADEDAVYSTMAFKSSNDMDINNKSNNVNKDFNV